MRAFALALLPIAGCTPAMQDAAPPRTIAAVAPPAEARATNSAIGTATIPIGQPLPATLAAAPTLGVFVRALDAAGLTESLAAAGPFTVFAPTDAAFARLQPGTVDALMTPANRGALVRLLRLHIVAGRLTGSDLIRRIAAGGGRTEITSLAGEPLTVATTAGIVTLTDAGGNISYIETADVRAANGVVHAVNGVLVPRLN